MLLLYSFKRGPDNTVTRAKLRAVFNGKQDPSDKTQYRDCSTHAPHRANLMTWLALAPGDDEDHVIGNGDAPEAYVWADNTDDDWIEIPPEFAKMLPPKCFPSHLKAGRVHPNGSKWCARVVGALYGKDNGGKIYEDARDEYLTTTCGLKQSFFDRSFFFNIHTDFRLVVTTDDFLWRGKRHACNLFAKQLEAAFGECGVSELGNHWTLYAGINLKWQNHRIFWSSRRAIQEALIKHNLQDISRQALPASHSTSITKYDRAEESERSKTVTAEYLSKMGSVNYIVAQTGRFDAYTASKHLASVMANPKPTHCSSLTRMFQYLKHSRDMTLTWNVHKSRYRKNQLYYYADGSFAGEHFSSRMGVVAMLNGGAVDAQSQLTKFQCTGVFDVEEAAACLATKDAVYRAAFLEELGYPQDTIPILCDNAATVLFSRNDTVTALNKHILIRGAYTRCVQKSGLIQLIHIPGTTNLADDQTKIVGIDLKYKFLDLYGFIDIPSTDSRS